MHLQAHVLGLLLGASLAQALPSANESYSESYESSDLPIVELSHERHQAISYDDAAGTYNFSNIRFAQPPIGDLRFRAPLPVDQCTADKPLNNGSFGGICAQPFTFLNDPAVTEWILSYIAGKVLDLDELEQKVANSSKPAPDPRISEDCLFLDVIVPKKIYEGRKSQKPVPVLVWIFGGGYIIGDKNGKGLYDPSGLLEVSEALGDDGFVFVAMNYRLGSLGFLGGPSIESSGTSNVGLLDQRFALDWVQDNIHLFGGSPDHVTLMGESAGGGSVLHQLTAYGGKNTSVPFTQIITQSAGFVPAHSRSAREQTLQYVMSLANVSSVEELRQLPTDTMIAINNIAALALPQGAFHPGVDGTFVLEPPGRVLLSGDAPKVNALIGTNSHEGILFGDPRINTTAAYADFVRTVVPGISNASAAYVEQTLYPPVFDGSLGYHNNFERAYLTFQEFVFTCNQPFVSKGLKDTTTDYQFAFSPGIHSQDLGYTFYSGYPIPASLSLFPPTTPTDFSSAKTLQTWIASFITHGTPSGTDGQALEPYRSAGNFTVLQEAHNETQVINGKFPSVSEDRCDWLAKKLLDGTLLA